MKTTTELNLEVTTAEQAMVKRHLTVNASEVLADKINNGAWIEKDGKRLLNRKDLAGFFNYACEEARKQAEKGARFACIDDQTVYGMAVHYFEEDSIIGVLYNEDGSEAASRQPPRLSAAGNLWSVRNRQIRIQNIPLPNPKRRCRSSICRMMRRLKLRKLKSLNSQKQNNCPQVKFAMKLVIPN